MLRVLTLAPACLHCLYASAGVCMYVWSPQQFYNVLHTQPSSHTFCLMAYICKLCMYV